MQKKINSLMAKAIIFLIVLQSISVFIPTSEATEYIIDGDKVYIDDEFVYLSAEPHTIIETEDVVFELISKQFGGEIDVAFGINNTNMSVKNPRLWNGTAWNPLNKNIQVVNQIYQGYNKWYLLKNVNINEDVLYRLKLTVDVKFNTSGKYFFGVKRSIDPISQGYYIDPWWDSNWNYYRTITIDHTFIETPLTNFPLMVYIPPTITPGCDGGDSIRFVSLNNVTTFAYEIEYWHIDGSYAWVNTSETIPSGTDYKFLMYYNNSGASDNQNPTGVWDSNYQCVYHMNETSGNISDATIYGNSGVKAGSPGYSNTGQIGTAIEFGGTNDYFKGVLAKEEMDRDTSFFEFWVKPDLADTTGIALGWVYVDDNRFYLGQSDTDTGKWRYGWGDQYEYYGTPDTNWHYLSYIVTSGEVISAYVDTTFYISENSAAFSTGTSDIFIGVGIENISSYRFDGLIDEVRISNSSRNVSWMNASYHSMNQTTGFLTWGSEIAGLNPPTGFIANTTSNSSIFLNWTKGADSTNTYISRKTGGYPTTRTDGTNIYNSTGVNFSDSSLSTMTVYYYGAWGFNSTTGNWSTGTGATNHTGPTNPTSVNAAVGADYLNITWTKGLRVDTTTIVRNATSVPTSPTDGTEIYNGSGVFYNDTSFIDGNYYRLYSWNDTIGLFSTGVDGAYGSLIIDVFNESDPSQNVTYWNIHIKNQDGSQTYTAYDNNNSHTIDVDNIPTGENISIKVWADDYEQRLKIVDLFENQLYTVRFYLPPLASPIYYIRVVETYETSSGSFAMAVEDAKVTFQRYINTTDTYENISSLLTDANGYINLYLIPSDSYQIIITKPGYTTKISDYLPQPPNEFGQTIEKTFRITRTSADDEIVEDISMVTMTLSVYNSTTMWIYYLNLDGDNNYVIFDVYDFIGSSLLTSYNISVNPNNVSIYFNFSGYSLSGNILKVRARAARLNGTTYILNKYFNTEQATDRGMSTAPIAAMLSIGICLFGLTIAHPKKVFGFIGIITMIMAIAITAFSEQIWYIHLIQAVEIILLIIIFLIFREEGVHAV